MRPRTFTLPVETVSSAGRLPWMLLCAVAPLAALTAPAAEAVTPPVHCQADSRGANDRPGQRDLTRFCIDRGDRAPYELHASSSFDEIEVRGANTLDVCQMFDINGDTSVNFAVCVTLGNAGDGSSGTQLHSVRLLRCNDTKADRCAGAVLLAGAGNTVCELGHPDTDPFGPADGEGPGDAYPFDSEVVCALDLDDFDIPLESAWMLDACSFPSASTVSDPEDCILYATCTDAAACDDGNACTVDTCDGSGVCAHTAAGGAPCSDGLFCTGAETCNDLGFCDASGEPLSCDDGVACTVDDCDELEDTCIHDARASLCDDAHFCNGVETCDAGAGCRSGTPPDCSDDVSCTTDFCDDAAATCGHVASDAACDDGRVCNGVETCSETAGCEAGVAPVCNDGVACTNDACDEVAGGCTAVPDDGACDDGAFCNGDETCDALAGCRGALPRTCSDGIECTLDSCDEGSDACVHATDHSRCDDGTFCNGVETCGNAGCEPGDAPCDGTASCNEAARVCAGCVADADCSDGVFCNGEERCAGGVCLAGDVETCDDGVACTVDGCDESAAACVHTPSAARCDDGLFCNGLERCDAVADCQAGAPACDDDIECTDDSCNEVMDRCVHRPVDARCDNGRVCDGVERCEIGEGCVEGEDVVCEADRFVCSTESCVESEGGCVSDFSRCVCGDREVVGLEECDPPARAGTFEDCNNLVDDDSDGAADCLDLECMPGSKRGNVCDENCELDVVCARIGSDPAVIRFDRHDRPDRLWIHGRFPVEGAPEPLAGGFELKLSNATQPVYRAALGVGDFAANESDEGSYSFRDPTARVLGGESARAGLSRVSVTLRTVGGVPYVSFRVRAYGDFSNATNRFMTSEVSVGADVGSLTSEWTAASGRWILRQREF